MTLRRIETPYGHRYTLDGVKVPGVTTLLSGGLPKPALPRWAAKVCAEYVATNLETLNALPDAESIVSVVKQAPWSERDRAAVRGTDIHKIAEDLVHGRKVEVPEHLQGPVDGYVQWLDKWQPEAILTEFVVANRTWWYAGTGDVIYKLPNGERVLADFKTSRGVYGETACQTASYRHAEFYLAADGTEQPLPEVDSLAVVHIRPDQTDLYRISDPESAWRDAKHIFWVAKAVDRISKQITDPSEPPLVEAVAE